MVKWIRGKWRYTLTTDGLTAVIQIDDTGGLDPEEVLYPYDYPRPLLSREFGDDEDMKIELLKITGYAKATLKKRGFKEYRIFFGQEDWELVPKKKAQQIPLPHPLPRK